MLVFPLSKFQFHCVAPVVPFVMLMVAESHEALERVNEFTGEGLINMGTVAISTQLPVAPVMVLETDAV